MMRRLLPIVLISAQNCLQKLGDPPMLATCRKATSFNVLQMSSMFHHASTQMWLDQQLAAFSFTCTNAWHTQIAEKATILGTCLDNKQVLSITHVDDARSALPWCADPIGPVSLDPRDFRHSGKLFLQSFPVSLKMKGFKRHETWPWQVVSL